MASYRMTFDLHTHTKFMRGTTEISHATGTVLENVKAAQEKGLKAIGISNHGPGHVVYGMPMGNLDLLRQEIAEAREAYPDVRIYVGIEGNFIDEDGSLDITEEQGQRFDYVMAGYHYGIFGSKISRAVLIHAGNWIWDHVGFARNWMEKITGFDEEKSLAELLFEANTDMTVAAVMRHKPKVLTHPGDKGYFDIEKIAKACAQTGTWMEINNHHESLSVEGLREAMKHDVHFVIGSDAHSPEGVGTFEKALERALAAGVPLERIVNIEDAEAKAEESVEAVAPVKSAKNRFAIQQGYRTKQIGQTYRRRQSKAAAKQSTNQ